MLRRWWEEVGYKQRICGLHGNQSTSWLPLTQMAKADIHYCVDKLRPIVVDMVQDFKSLAKLSTGGLSFMEIWTAGGDHWVREQGWWGRMGRAGKEDREGGQDNHTIVIALKNSLYVFSLPCHLMLLSQYATEGRRK